MLVKFFAFPAIAFALSVATGCAANGEAKSDSAAGAPEAAAGSSAAASSAHPTLTDADLDAYERGMKRESELVRAAQTRAVSAADPNVRGKAIQDQFDAATIPEGAKAAGMSDARYHEVRQVINELLKTLSFQGKINGPMHYDTSRANAAMKQKLAADAFAGFPASTVSVIKSRLDQLVAVWSDYVKLTAVGG